MSARLTPFRAWLARVLFRAPRTSPGKDDPQEEQPPMIAAQPPQSSQSSQSSQSDPADLPTAAAKHLANHATSADLPPPTSGMPDVRETARCGKLAVSAARAWPAPKRQRAFGEVSTELIVSQQRLLAMTATIYEGLVPLLLRQEGSRTSVLPPPTLGQETVLEYLTRVGVHSAQKTDRDIATLRQRQRGALEALAKHLEPLSEEARLACASNYIITRILTMANEEQVGFGNSYASGLAVGLTGYPGGHNASTRNYGPYHYQQNYTKVTLPPNTASNTSVPMVTGIGTTPTGTTVTGTGTAWMIPSGTWSMVGPSTVTVSGITPNTTIFSTNTTYTMTPPITATMTPSPTETITSASNSTRDLEAQEAFETHGVELDTQTKMSYTTLRRVIESYSAQIRRLHAMETYRQFHLTRYAERLSELTLQQAMSYANFHASMGTWRAWMAPNRTHLGDEESELAGAPVGGTHWTLLRELSAREAPEATLWDTTQDMSDQLFRYRTHQADELDQARQEAAALAASACVALNRSLRCCMCARLTRCAYTFAVLGRYTLRHLLVPVCDDHAQLTLLWWTSQTHAQGASFADPFAQARKVSLQGEYTRDELRALHGRMRGAPYPFQQVAYDHALVDAWRARQGAEPTDSAEHAEYFQDSS